MADKLIAEKRADVERVADLDGRDAAMRPAPGPAEHAAQDVLIERPDLGPNAATLVVKGEPIPPELVDLPRRPAGEHEPKPKRGKG